MFTRTVEQKNYDELLIMQIELVSQSLKEIKDQLDPLEDQEGINYIDGLLKEMNQPRRLFNKLDDLERLMLEMETNFL